MILKAPTIARVSRPGQFAMLKAPGVFLRRPLSIAGVNKDGIEFIYRVVGAGTRELSLLPRESALDIIAPLGNGYEYDLKNRVPLLVAGGTGIASLRFLALSMPVAGVLFYGGKTKNDILPLKEIAARGWKILIATEDGSRGHKGFVTDLLKRHIGAGRPGNMVLYTCGPHGMEKCVSQIAADNNIPGYVSLEEMMACGTGNCQGCAVKTGDSYKMVCSDGPVFNINDICF